MRFSGLTVGCGVIAAALVGLVLAVAFWSGATLAPDPVALARVEVQPLGGTLVSARAFGPGGRRIPLTLARGRLTPREPVPSGERVSVEIVVRRPGWLRWALGAVRRERLTVQTPVAAVATRWLTVASAAPLRLRFDRPVSAVAYGPAGGRAREIAAGGQETVSLDPPRRPVAGVVEVAAAARPWERLGRRVAVAWFPNDRLPVVVSRPAPGTRITPFAHVRLTFSKPVADVLGSSLPSLAPRVAGTWRQTDSHTLALVPPANGIPLATSLHLRLPRPVAALTEDGTIQPARVLDWSVPAGSLLRLQQLLADEGYLPVAWTATEHAIPRTPEGQMRAAVDPPSGRFSWRYPNTPPELQALWSPGQPNAVTRGAVMMFEHDHGLAVDAIAGPRVWQALIADAVAGTRHDGGYSYVYVHRSIPQRLTLWHDGRVVLTSPGNTGVPAAPTQLGTWPVFEHIPVGTMSGTNPDGSRYHDPGIRWISYFHGGDALHAFNRASFGTPQSLGCVELPLDDAARVWPYTPIGTLVTIEN